MQLQQPADTAIRAAYYGRRGGARVVADGGLPADVIDELLPLVDVLRADATEVAQLSGARTESTSDTLRVANRLLEKGPSLVALAVPGEGDLLAWGHEHRLYPYSDEAVVDATGAGDAFTAALIAALRSGASYRDAGTAATRAAAATVGHLGGRPELSGH